MELAYIAIGAGLVILTGIGLVTLMKKSGSRSRPGEVAAVIEECTIVDGAKACTRRAYDDVADMPPEVRAAYEHTAALED